MGKFPIIKKLDNLGRFVISSDLRKAYGFKPNEEFLIYLKEDGIFITPMPKEKNRLILGRFFVYLKN